MHSRPSSAHAVAVATPCWPAPVSAMMRVLPMRRASSAWPSALLILCAPVWSRSSRLSQTGWPTASESRRASYSGVGRPAKSRSRRCEVGVVAVVGARLDPRRLELGERGHQRLGDELAPVGAEAVLDGGHAAQPPPASPAAISRKRRTFSGSLMPGSRSVPGRGVDRPRVDVGDRLGEVVGAEAAGEDQRRLRAPPLEQAPLPRLAAAAAEAGRGGVEQVEVGVEALEVADVARARHARGLDDLAAGPARRPRCRTPGPRRRGAGGGCRGSAPPRARSRRASR